MHESRDCVVMGGGPAGSTFAAILKKYAPEVQVTVLEQAHHPRFHVGESLIPVVNGVLRELGVFEKCYDGRFVRKLGITFVWGKDRKPWDADYLEIAGMEPGHNGVINVVGQDFSSLMRQEMRRDIPLTSMNVLRSEFDKLLIDTARDFGAEVREGTRVSALHRGVEPGQPHRVEWKNDQGQSGVIETPFVLDATGLNALGTRGQRIYEPTMNNLAVWGYWKGADWKVLFRGERQATTVFICSIDHGWIWYIPVAEDTISCGVVTRSDYFRDALQGIDLEGFYRESIRSCAEVHALTKHGELRTDILPDGKRVAQIKDWSSWTPHPVGPGFATAGDAAVFVDPILSTGLTLAMQSGHRAALTFNTLRHRPELPATELWSAYADYLRGEYGSFLTLARYFYGNNKAADSWWWQAHRVVNRAGHLDLDSKQAFTMATAGFFPTPRAISLEIMAPLIAGIVGSDADLMNVYHESGVLADRLPQAGIQVNTPFKLALRTESPLEPKGGLLETYHDLVCEGYDMAHRLAASPARMGKDLAPIALAAQRHTRVADLLAEAPRLVPHVSPDAVRQATLALLTNAAKKGFVSLT